MSRKKNDAVITTVPAGTAIVNGITIKPARIINDKTIFELCDTSLFEGYLPIMPAIPEGNPNLTWKGALIPEHVYCRLTSFMYWSYKETKGEAQARLAYNTLTHEWDIIVMPQEKGTGMATVEIPDHPDRNAAQAVLTIPGYITAGTAHHHCDMSAFQSGTDKTDEDRQDGLHITFGKLNEAELDVHARVTLRGTTYLTSLSKWIEFPEIPAVIPATFHEDLRKYWLLHPNKVEFPEVWKTRLIQPPKVEVTYFNTDHNYGTYRGMHNTFQIVDLDKIAKERPWLLNIAKELVEKATTLLDAREAMSTLGEILYPVWKSELQKKPCNDTIEAIDWQSRYYGGE